MMIVRAREQTGMTGKRGSQFTGTAYPHLTLSKDGVTVNTVNFSPGARTHWHAHENGQILQVVAGRGLVGSRDGAFDLICAGDTIWTPPGEEHWHGATQDSYLTHVAISLGATQWAEEVEQDLYVRASAGAAG